MHGTCLKFNFDKKYNKLGRKYKTMFLDELMQAFAKLLQKRFRNYLVHIEMAMK